MSTSLLAVIVLALVAAVIARLFVVMWRARTSARDAQVALVSVAVLSAWATISTVLAFRGSFEPDDAESVPPIGISLAAAFILLAVSLAGSPTLRRLLGNPASVIRLHVWRLLGIVFLILMMRGALPVLWALPAGTGDVFIGATAMSIARAVDTQQARRRAIAWNLFGMLDLIVAIGLGIATNPGRFQFFHTTPTANMMARFPLALVPTFLVPLAFTLHFISLSQLFGDQRRRTT